MSRHVYIHAEVQAADPEDARDYPQWRRVYRPTMARGFLENAYGYGGRNGRLFEALDRLGEPRGIPGDVSKDVKAEWEEDRDLMPTRGDHHLPLSEFVQGLEVRDLGDFRPVFDRLKELAQEIGGEKLRIVFWNTL